MTIAISIKVNDGIVLAADSAATIMGQDSQGKTGVINIYNTANKIFNLRKGLPIGAITWGAGSIGYASISTLVKDFRKLITYDDNWKIKTDSYKIEEIAEKFKEFIFEKHYKEEFKSWPEKPFLGFMIVGYSYGEPLAEEWMIEIQNGKCKGPYLVRKPNEVGITWNGETEAITRLYLGFGTGLPIILKEYGLKDVDVENIIKLCRQKLTISLVIPPMPIQDAIDLAEFLVKTTIYFFKFAPGAPTVGGPIEIAAITKHEGFKWIKRKHYFDIKLNPQEEIK